MFDVICKAEIPQPQNVWGLEVFFYVYVPTWDVYQFRESGFSFFIIFRKRLNGTKYYPM